ncbi:MAG: ATP-binding protein [Sulfurovum sp.]|uniref:ATP-binding protein n=1 Tax=Sulfurovum sp. TaxID=1969726 RepID=UPI003C76CF2C
MKYLRKILPKTLKSKLRIALFGIGFFPYFLILIYSYNLGEKKILDNTMLTYHNQMTQVKKRVEDQFLSLQKEMRFLASLDIMNDMIVGDVDKRISQLLMQKKKDLGLEMDLFTLTSEKKVISSTAKSLPHDFAYISEFNKILRKNKNYFFTDKSIILFTPINSTLQKNKLLGYLCLEYALSNLDSYTTQANGIRSIFYHFDSSAKIGDVYNNELLLDIKEQNTQYVSDHYLVLHEQFEGIMSEWMIVYMINKSVALIFLDSFILFVWALFALGVIIIALISFWISRRILEPIAKLSDATKSIISTQDYTTQVSISSQGEISELANDFNIMVRETNRAFKILEEENQVRLLRFVQLINIFNGLIQTQTEEACITLAINELQILMPHQHFSFSQEYPKQNEGNESNQYLMLYVKDFEKQTSDFYGVITLGESRPITDPHEEKFYRSIATMIMLQLDQIRLIEQTQAVSHAKSTFISHMSHELRTPLHTILSSTQYLIAYENLTHHQQEMVETMQSSADHLLGMINDILDLVKIESGKVTIDLVQQKSDEIEVLTQHVINMLEVLAEQKEIPITFNNRLTKRMKVTIDIRYFKQILINLLSNAIKFTEYGSIDLTLEKCGESLCLSIQDSGIGISEDDLKNVFDEFSQVKNKSKNTEKGSGLGLPISRKLARLFQADVIIESKGLGYGTKALIKFGSSLVEENDQSI